MDKFEVRSKVRWTSQSQGYTTKKVGEVVAVVPAGCHPKDCIPRGYKLRPTGLPRNHESYLVSAKGHGTFLLWPRVDSLERA
jgi:hypothetical protein